MRDQCLEVGPLLRCGDVVACIALGLLLASETAPLGGFGVLFLADESAQLQWLAAH